MKKLLFILLLLPALVRAQSLPAVLSLTIGATAYPNASANNLVSAPFPVGANLSALVQLAAGQPLVMLAEGTPAGSAYPTYSATFAAPAGGGAVPVPLGPVQLPAGVPFVLRFYARPGNEVLATYTILNTGTPLPVRLVSFTARAAGPGALVSWQSASEQQLRGYTLQQSADGAAWLDGATVPATGAGSYQLATASRANYYRLRCTDLDGSTTFSPVVSLPAAGPGSAHLVQVGERYFSFQLPEGERPARLLLYDMSGRLLLTQSENLHQLATPAAEQPRVLLLISDGNRAYSQRVN